MGTVQPPVPLQPPPDHPPNVEPADAAAVSVTAEPELKLAAHVAPQLIPAGDEVTVPVPAPPGLTVSVNAGAACTTWLKAGEMLAAYVASPEYSAVIECVA